MAQLSKATARRIDTTCCTWTRERFVIRLTNAGKSVGCKYGCSTKELKMGDKKSKKDKDKSQKRQAAKQGQKDAAKQAKNHPKKP